MFIYKVVVLNSEIGNVPSVGHRNPDIVNLIHLNQNTIHLSTIKKIIVDDSKQKHIFYLQCVDYIVDTAIDKKSCKMK